MFSKNGQKGQNRIDTLVSAETRITGDIQFEGGLRVDGLIRGNITESVQGTLVLSESGSIEGAVTVSRVMVNGRITGPVRAGHYIELQAKSHVTGDVYYQSLEMHTGAVIEGTLIYIGTQPAAGIPPLIADSSVNND